MWAPTTRLLQQIRIVGPSFGELEPWNYEKFVPTKLSKDQQQVGDADLTKRPTKKKRAVGTGLSSSTYDIWSRDSDIWKPTAKPLRKTCTH